MSPGSNYLQVLPRIRELAAANKLDSLLRARFTPTTAALRAEWAKRNDQVRFKFLTLASRDVSLEREATHEEIVAYFDAHPGEFERRRRARMRYVRLDVPPVADSLRASAERNVQQRARDIADSLKKDLPIDSIVRGGVEVHESGLLEMPPVAVPGLGREPELLSAFAPADSNPSAHAVVGPVVVAAAGWWEW